MQHNILKHKNKITSISGLLIALGLAKGTYANMRQNILIAVGVVIIL